MKLTKEQIELAFSGVGDHEPVLRALRQVMGEFIADEMLSAINSNLSPEARAYNCGRAAGANDLKELLLDFGLKLEATE